MKVLVVVEDDPDIQFLIQTVFLTDQRFSVLTDQRFSVLAGVASAEEGFELARTTEPTLIVLDHGLAGELTGLEAAPRFKELAPQARIILFTAHAELRIPAEAEPAIDAFLLKTDIEQLLPLAQQLTGVDPPSG
jgi:NtrC-family two-component system response regulator AlgB